MFCSCIIIINNKFVICETSRPQVCRHSQQASITQPFVSIAHKAPSAMMTISTAQRVSRAAVDICPRPGQRARAS